MDKFGWAYIGCGGIAHTTAKELVKSDSQQIVAAYNRTYEKAEKTGSRCGSGEIISLKYDHFKAKELHKSK